MIVRTLEKETQDALGNETLIQIKNKEIEEAINLGMLRQIEELADESIILSPK